MLSDLQLIFEKQELDDACKDKRFTSNIKVEFVLDPATDTLDTGTAIYIVSRNFIVTTTHCRSKCTL